jgi:hypothetical protein
VNGNVLRRKNRIAVFVTTSEFVLRSVPPMVALPQTGTGSLLEKLAPFLDDALIDELVRRTRGPGRPRAFSSAQLFRVLLLSLLTPTHSFNLLVQLLSENRAWRKFARLPNQRLLPDAKMLHQFRARLDLQILRHLNAALIAPLIDELDPARLPVAIMDATDLPAAANSFKKTRRIQRATRRSARARSKPARAAGLSATKNTACAFGSRSTRTRSCSLLLRRGPRQPIAAMCSFWSQAYDISASVWTSRQPWSSRTWPISTWRHNGDCAKNFRSASSRICRPIMICPKKFNLLY